ncbi:DNA repair-scaffolding protein [Varanus komodoensis]|nr:DNA repair-scaffolding protein [Varanus komodoensis]
MLGLILTSRDNLVDEVAIAEILKDAKCDFSQRCTLDFRKANFNEKTVLLQRTFSSLLESSPTDHGSYGVKSLLGQEVGTLYCYVQSVVRYPASCVGLEEIVLPDTGKTKGMLSASLKYS